MPTKSTEVAGTGGEGKGKGRKSCSREGVKKRVRESQLVLYVVRSKVRMQKRWIPGKECRRLIFQELVHPDVLHYNARSECS